jgi:hypothetical protein
MGLNRVKSKLKAIRKLQKDLETGKIFRKIVKDNKKTILDWNRNEQLFKEGINNDGTKIEFTPDSFKINAKDPKTADILKPYRPGRGGRGPKVLGLTPENKQRLLDEIVMPAINELIDKISKK